MTIVYLWALLAIALSLCVLMPSHHLIRQYADLFEVEKEWRWSGTHYQRTALDWLARFDAHASGPIPTFASHCSRHFCECWNQGPLAKH
jgi:cyclopropane fatty-acyl-phospholipid synthase-like methyltransferase